VLLERIDVREDGALLLVGIEGSHFLWRMVRRIVGVLVAVGRGDLRPPDVEALLGGGSELPARLTAPASGLFLDRVYYKGDTRDVAITAPTPLDRR
jgi:tRNA pseudouridine38-40 synthase